MLFKIVKFFEQFTTIPKAKAHCDVPCGIYDPMIAQINAMTVARMTDTILDKEKHENDAHGGAKDASYLNTISAAETVKQEVRILWGDYFKQPHFDAHPELPGLCHEIMLIASKCRQGVDAPKSRELVSKVNALAGIFYKTKSIDSEAKKYHCKPNLDIVLPKL